MYANDLVTAQYLFTPGTGYGGFDDTEAWEQPPASSGQVTHHALLTLYARCTDTLLPLENPVTVSS